MHNPKIFETCFTAPYALFTRPESKASGEKDSYMVPTYEALVGMIECIYWKPSIVIVVDECRIMNPFRSVLRYKKHVDTASSAFNRAIMAYRMLENVQYKVRFHIEPNLARPDLRDDARLYKKHEEMMARFLKYGGRKAVYFGSAMSDTFGYVQETDFDAGTGAFDLIEKYELGTMFFGFRYPDRASLSVDLPVRVGAVESYFWRPTMERGVIRFPRPKDVLDMRNIFCASTMSTKNKQKS